ncbi:DUF7546 family protein [Mesorhizobium kowhaii]|uniref:DUF7546 family protein n=1 Tax=Mesorhizobium kowhaii TaxID=1300272 RepID=UPI003CCAD6BC
MDGRSRRYRTRNTKLLWLALGRLVWRDPGSRQAGKARRADMIGCGYACLLVYANGTTTQACHFGLSSFVLRPGWSPFPT